MRCPNAVSLAQSVAVVGHHGTAAAVTDAWQVLGRLHQGQLCKLKGMPPNIPGGTDVRRLTRGLATRPQGRYPRALLVSGQRDGRPTRGAAGSALLLCV